MNDCAPGRGSPNAYRALTAGYIGEKDLRVRCSATCQDLARACTYIRVLHEAIYSLKKQLRGFKIILLRTPPLWGWALQGDSGAGHSRETWGWALQGDSKVGHSRERGTPWVGHSGQGDSALGHSRKTWGWALQGDSGVGHSRRLSWGWALLGK